MCWMLNINELKIDMYEHREKNDLFLSLVLSFLTDDSHLFGNAVFPFFLLSWPLHFPVLLVSSEEKFHSASAPTHHTSLLPSFLSPLSLFPAQWAFKFRDEIISVSFCIYHALLSAIDTWGFWWNQSVEDGGF